MEGAAGPREGLHNRPGQRRSGLFACYGNPIYVLSNGEDTAQKQDNGAGWANIEERRGGLVDTAEKPPQTGRDVQGREVEPNGTPRGERENVFYTRGRNGEKKEITGGEVIYTRCAACGEEIEVPLVSVAIYGGVDLLKDTMRCGRCILERERREQEESQERRPRKGESGFARQSCKSTR